MPLIGKLLNRFRFSAQNAPPLAILLGDVHGTCNLYHISEIFQEGLRLPPVRICCDGKIDESLLRVILADVRTPDERRGDLMAQVAANYNGQLRLSALLGKSGVEQTCEAMASLIEYSKRMTRAMIREIPDGVYAFADALDDDGISPESVRIAVQIKIAGDRATIDFAGAALRIAERIRRCRALDGRKRSYPGNRVLNACYRFHSLRTPEVPSLRITRRESR